MLCSAGKREFRTGRYQMAVIADGVDFANEIEFFRKGVRDHAKTGLLAIVAGSTGRYARSIDELNVLGRVMYEAGLCANPEAVINGSETVAVEIETTCPVTRQLTDYSFFPVAFCQNANNPDDPLYDPSLSAPFTGINMTSDAFAFALLVQEQCRRQHGCEPSDLPCRHAAEALFSATIRVWNQMSANTITSYGKRSVCPERAVSLSEDRLTWYAAHNDPVFAETSKEIHSHEMPVVYARRLCDMWLSAMFDGQSLQVGREGQTGGVYVG